MSKPTDALEVLRHFRDTFESVAMVQELENGKSQSETHYEGDAKLGYRSLLMAFQLIHKNSISKTDYEKIDNAVANLTELIKDSENKKSKSRKPHTFANPKDYATKTIETLEAKEFGDKGCRSIFIVLSGSMHTMLAEIKEYVDGELSARIYNGGKYKIPIEEKMGIFKVVSERKIESIKQLNLFLQDVLLFKKGDKEAEKRMVDFLKDETSEINFIEGIPQHVGNCQSNSLNIMVNECIGYDDEGATLSVKIRDFIESKSRKKIVSQIEKIVEDHSEESKSSGKKISVKNAEAVLERESGKQRWS